jgi:hypothetical protein
MSDIVERLRGAAHTYDEQGVHSEIELEAAQEIEKLRAALRGVLDACDQGWKVERSVGGMTVEGQMRRSFYNRVPAWPIEEARAALGEKE